MPNNPFLRDVYRILDANLNRAKEGLRVCEDICRFHLKAPKDAGSLNRMRHRVTTIVKGSGLRADMLLECRNIKEDVGKSFAFGPKRASFKDVFSANAQRVKEALRSLEEFLKIFSAPSSKKIQALRFAFYESEKKIMRKFLSLSDPR